MDKKKSIQSWLDAAVAGIRFKPDRAEVERELRGHIEDKMADLRRLYVDLTWEEAEKLALSRMGDPEEIGRELAKVHRPWLGYLWQASRWLAWAALCLLVVVIGYLGGPQNLWNSIQTEVEYQIRCLETKQDLFGRTVPEGCTRLALYTPGADARQGRCTVSVPRAVLMRYLDQSATLYVEVRLEYDNLWEVSDLPFYYLWAEDSLGNRYFEGQTGYSSTGDEMRGLNWTGRYLCLSDFPEEAQWVRFHYLPGTDLDLKIDLTRGAGT